MLRKIVASSLVGFLVLAAPCAHAQTRREIRFPDIPGYRTLKCDFHAHTVFSDGAVWPTVRVDEAWRLGLDAIAITDHVEYQPHKDDVSTRRNRSYELAAGRAQERDVILVRGAEITRDTPPGHFNAIFVEDVEALAVEDLLEVFARANAQGAFVFWNHHEWKGPELGVWTDFHTTVWEKKWLQGIELANGPTYYPQAHRWAIEKGLVLVGNSDIHDPDLSERYTAESHRTLTLAFAKERTLAALKEAVFAGRTAVWYQGQVLGSEEWLAPLFRASVRVEPPHLRVSNAVFAKVANDCDLDIQLERRGALGPAAILLRARSVTLLKVGTAEPKKALALEYAAKNLVVGPDGAALAVQLEIPGESP